jgi:hypothetical protein
LNLDLNLGVNLGVVIVGAGMAGLLAGNLLLRRQPEVREAQASLPNNHSATLRFRTSAVGDATGIPFKRVLMVKGSVPWRNPIADALSYSYKNTGQRRSDRSIVEGMVAQERYIAPRDFIYQLAEPLGSAIKFGHQEDFSGPGPFISTIPMPALAKVLNYPYQEDIQFKAIPGINIRGRVRACDAYVSLLVPDPTYPFTRITLTGDELIVEIPNTLNKEYSYALKAQVADLLGIFKEDIYDLEVHQSPYQKILPMTETPRRLFLHWATDQHNVFSLGRYATARPGLLLDELIQDVRLIAGWIDNRYDMARQR